MNQPARPELTDFEPERAQFLEEVQQGLGATPKTLPCKYFYDERGSQLFDQICELPEYYPTRTELSIMEKHSAAMASVLGPRCRLVEYGSGSSGKTRLLLNQLQDPAAYLPLDISRDHLLTTAGELKEEYPNLEVLPVCADFTEPFELPDPQLQPQCTAIYFPGSTIGNFTRSAATELVEQVHHQIGSGGIFLIGVDLVKETAVLEKAYDDAAGVTADFNLNLLLRANSELGANFDLEQFRHKAVWCAEPGRIEMHLVSLVAQRVRVGQLTFDFEASESICTEHSHKYTLAGFASLAAEGGFDVEQVWMDDEELFSVQALRAR